MARPRKSAVATAESNPKRLTLNDLDERVRVLANYSEGSGVWRADTAWKVERTGAIFRVAVESKDLARFASKVQAKLDEYDRLCAGYSGPKRVLCRDYVETCVSEIWKGKLAVGTIREHSRNLRKYFLPAFGGLYLDAVERDEVRSILTCDQAPLNPKCAVDRLKVAVAALDEDTRANIKSAISKLFSTAREDGKAVPEIHPTENVKIDRKKVKFDAEKFRIEHVRVLTEEEQARMLSWAHWAKPALMLGFHAGLRRGEILMLEWRKVDFRNGWIVVDDQLQRERGKGLQPQGKTKNRKVRFVEMNAELRSYLEDLRKENPRDRWVLQNTGGSPISPEDLNDAFSDLAWLSGLIDNRGEHGKPLADPSLHDMRHTFATRLARNGVPIHVVADLLGDTIEVCSRYYTHSDHGQRRRAVELLCQN